MTTNDYHIATLSQEEQTALNQIESEFKSETGKNYVLIAWEKGN